MAMSAHATITKQQVKLIHTLKSAMSMSDGIYRDVLWETFGVDSSKDLTPVQASLLIDDLKAKAIADGVWKPTKKQKRFEDLRGRHGYRATPPQLRMIEAIWQDVSRAEDADSRKKALRSFLMRVVKVSDLRFLDRDGAGKVINALTVMQKNAKSKSGKGC